jgi:hypothetical protein
MIKGLKNMTALQKTFARPAQSSMFSTSEPRRKPRNKKKENLIQLAKLSPHIGIAGLFIMTGTLKINIIL